MSMALSEMDRQLSGMLMPGVVVAVDAVNARVRIESDEWVSSWVPWLAMAAGAARHWRVPSVGEQAILLNPSGEPDNGFALCGFYTSTHGHDTRPEVVGWVMPDGAVIEYDFAASALLVNGCKTVDVAAADSVTVKSTKITLDADDVEVTNNLTVGAAINHLAKGGAKATFGGDIESKGSVKADGDVQAGDVSLVRHDHDDSHGGKTGPANQN